MAARYPWYDLARVGIYGGSAGGQNAMGALLFHGDFYKAAVAYAGCHDNRMDKIWWNEQWMGWPIGPQYVKALLRANKDFDLLVIPGAEHDAGRGGEFGSYGKRKRFDFFVKHLLPQDPPDWNR